MNDLLKPFRRFPITIARLIAFGAGVAGACAVPPSDPSSTTQVASALGVADCGTNAMTYQSPDGTTIPLCSVSIGVSSPFNNPPAIGSATPVGLGFELRSDGQGVPLYNFDFLPVCPFPDTGNPDGRCIDGDGLQFVYTKVPISGRNKPTDVEIVARITPAPDTPMNAQMGVMIRDSLDPKSLMAGAYLQHKNVSGCWTNGVFGTLHAVWRTQESNRPPRIGDQASNVRPDSSFWVRVQRVGRDFAVARSSDGRTWVPVSTLGSEIMGNTAFVGFFIASSGGPGVTARATFDNIAIRSPQLAAKTTWIGSSFAKVSTDYVSFGMHDFYVAPDGTSYKYSQAADGGHEINVITKDGALKKLPYELTSMAYGTPPKDGFYQGGIAGDSYNEDYIYVATRAGTVCQPSNTIDRLRMSDLEPMPSVGNSTLVFPRGRLGTIAGLAARKGWVYVSDIDVSATAIDGVCPYPPPFTPPTTIRALNTITGAENPGFQVEHAASLAVDDADRIWIVRSATDYPTFDVGVYNNPYGTDSPICPASIPNECAWNGPRYYCPGSVERSRYPANFVVERPGTVECWTRQGTRCPHATGLPDLTVTHPDGTSNPFNPVGITIDPGPNRDDVSDDRLLIADNGPAQNIFICTKLDGSAPGGQIPCSGFGMNGGVFSVTPGVRNAPTGASFARFFSPLKAGVGENGNIYVASSAPRVEIRKFTPSTTSPPVIQWSLYGLAPAVGSFDPGSDGRDFYTATERFSFDPAKTAAGSEWGPMAVTWNPFRSSPSRPGDRYQDALYPGGPAWLMRRLPTSQGMSRFAYQIADYNHVYLYRFDGEIAVPSGSLVYYPNHTTSTCFRSMDRFPGPGAEFNPTDMSPPYGGGGCVRLWIDRNGNGVEDRGTHPDPCKPCDGFTGSCEVDTIPVTDISESFTPDVDAKGNIWLGWKDKVWEIKASPGPTQPDYHLTGSGLAENVLPPALGSMGITPRYDGASPNDSLYLLVRTPDPACCPIVNNQPVCGTGQRVCACSQNYLEQVVRYDGWHAAPFRPAPRYPVVLPEPQLSDIYTDDFMSRYADPGCDVCAGDGTYTGFDVAGDKFFLHRRTGQVLAYDTSTGGPVAYLAAGPEMSGYQFLTDVGTIGGMRAFKRSNGEYLLSVPDSSNQARMTLLRWTPPVPGAWSPAQLAPRAWYDASPENVTVSPEGRVMSWTDRSGHGLHLGMESAALQPTYDPAGWSPTSGTLPSQPAVTFDGNAVLDRQRWRGAPGGNEQGLTVLAVFKASATGQTASLAAWSNAWNGDHVGAGVKTGPLMRLDTSRGPGGASDQTFAGGVSLSTIPHAAVWRLSSQMLEVFRDGVRTSGPALTTPGPLSLDRFVLGAATVAPSGGFRGAIAELIVVPAAITDADVASFTAYARQKWRGLP